MAKTRETKGRVKMLANLGWMDAKKYDLPGAGKDEALPVDGEVLEVTEAQERVLVDVLKCAEPEEEAPARRATRFAAEEAAAK